MTTRSARARSVTLTVIREKTPGPTSGYFLAALLPAAIITSRTNPSSAHHAMLRVPSCHVRTSHMGAAYCLLRRKPTERRALDELAVIRERSSLRLSLPEQTTGDPPPNHITPLGDDAGHVRRRMRVDRRSHPRPLCGRLSGSTVRPPRLRRVGSDHSPRSRPASRPPRRATIQVSLAVPPCDCSRRFGTIGSAQQVPPNLGRREDTAHAAASLSSYAQEPEPALCPRQMGSRRCHRLLRDGLHRPPTRSLAGTLTRCASLQE